MNPEVYTQEMRANHEICPYCGMWHTSMSCAPQFASQSLKIVDLESKLAIVESDRDRYKKALEEIANAEYKYKVIDDFVLVIGESELDIQDLQKFARDALEGK